MDFAAALTIGILCVACIALAGVACSYRGRLKSEKHVSHFWRTYYDNERRDRAKEWTEQRRIIDTQQQQIAAAHATCSDAEDKAKRLDAQIWDIRRALGHREA